MSLLDSGGGGGHIAREAMRISDRYIARQVLWGTLSAVALLSFVLLLGNLFKEMRPLLVDRQVPLPLVLQFMLNAVTASLMFSIPWGFLTVVLLVFGRMSAAHEITAFRVAGVSLTRLVAPVFAVAAALSGFCLWLNMEVVPKGRVSLDRLLYEQAKRDPGALLRPGVVLKFNNERVRMFVESESGGRKYGLHLYQTRPATADAPALTHWLHAGRFTYVVDHERQQLRLRLFEACFQSTKEDGSVEVVRAAEIEPYLIPFDQLFRQKAKASAMTLAELREYLAATPDAPAKAKVEVERRCAFSLACLVFALVGVPLGMQARRRESSGGLLTSLGLAGGYFLFMMLAGETKNATHASLLLWLPNGLCLVIGLWLFRRARHK